MASGDVRKLIGRKRTLEILELLRGNGEFHYSNIEQQVNSSSETIVSSLDLLVDFGLVDRYQRTPKDVRYEITESGRECLRLVESLERVLENEADGSD